jgi:hypothetical protein
VPRSELGRRRHDAKWQCISACELDLLDDQNQLADYRSLGLSKQAIWIWHGKIGWQRRRYLWLNAKLVAGVRETAAHDR